MNLPPLCTTKDVGTRILQQQRTEAAKAAAENIEMEMESDSEEEVEAPQAPPEKLRQMPADMDDHDHRMQNKKHAAYEVTQPAPAAPAPANVVIRDFDPKRGDILATLFYN